MGLANASSSIEGDIACLIVVSESAEEEGRLSGCPARPAVPVSAIIEVGASDADPVAPNVVTEVFLLGPSSGEDLSPR